MVVRLLAVDDEAAGAGGDVDEVDRGAEAAGLAEHHIAVAGIRARVAGAVGEIGPDDQVVEAVAVDVAGRGHREAARSRRPSSPWMTKPPRAGGDGGEVDRGAEAAGLAEHHIAVAGTSRAVAGAVGAMRPDDQVVEAVAVDVAGRGDRASRNVVRLLALDDEAAVPAATSARSIAAPKPPALPNTT